MDAATIIESESRELIRRRGLDVHADQLEPLIREVVADYDRRSSSGEVPVLREDDDSMVAEVAARIGGFGPLQEMLDDPGIEEIWLNSPSQVFCARNGRSELTTIVLSDVEVRGIVERMLVSSGRRLDMSSPFVDALLPDGSRLHVVIPSVTRQHWAINIRKFVAKAYDLEGLVTLGSLPQQAADFLDAAIASGLNVVASGATDTRTEPHMLQQARRHAILSIHDLSSVSGACEDQCMNTKRKVRGIRAPSVRAGHSLGVVPHAHLCEGGIVRKTYLGFSLKHAAKRAQRALGRSTSIQLGVS